MVKSKLNFYFFLLGLIFLSGNVYVSLFQKDSFVLYNLLPFLLFGIYIFITDIEKIVWLMVASTPLAITLKELGLSNGFDLSLPTEPLMAALMLVYALHLVRGKVNSSQFLKHPITVLISIQILWMLITSISSVDFIISIKYFISRCWFVFSCYFFTSLLFKDFIKVQLFILLYSIPLAIVCVITILKHAPYGFDDKIADWIVSPFFNDHTAYGAALAMFIPVFVSMLFLKEVTFLIKGFVFTILLLFIAAIILSYARAGWLSLVLASSVFITLLLKIKFRTLFLSFMSILFLFLVFQNQIIRVLGKNDTDSEGDFSKNISSMSNISTDASNLERLNRWSCALKMFEKKPVMGWGPGTYMFNYAVFQKSSEKTIISTNFGTNGNAHSEYLGPLCEQGLPGLLFVLLILFVSMFMGYRVIYKTKDFNKKVMATGIFLGLFTYFVHGFLNNFLDTDKLSVPFWCFLAILVCLDIQAKSSDEIESQN